MCKIIVVNKGENEIRTPREFLEYFGFSPDFLFPILNMDDCLCGYDIEGVFKIKKIPFKTDGGDIYVGMLIEIKL